MKFLATFATMMILAGSAHAQMQCSDLFDSHAITIVSTIFSHEKQADPKESAILLLKILKMASQGRAAEFTEKQVLEKGELLLAQNLGDGWSIEAEYSVDQRGPLPMYRMRKVILVKPNGDEVFLDKAPLDTSGNAFRSPRYNLESYTMHISETEVHFPLAVEGLLYQHMSKWATHAEYVKSTEFRSLETENDLKVLRGKVLSRSIVDYTNKVIKKQSYKFALLGFVMYLYSQKDQISQTIHPEDPWDKMVSIGSIENMTEKDLGSVRPDILRLIDKENQPVLDAIRPARKAHPKPTEFEKLIVALEDLNRLERSSGGRPVAVYFDNEKQVFRDLKYKHVAPTLTQVFEEQDSIYVVYPVTGRAVVLSASLAEVSGASDLILPVVVDAKSQPKLFDLINKHMNSVKKDSK